MLVNMGPLPRAGLSFDGLECLRHIDRADFPPQDEVDKQAEHQRQRNRDNITHP